MTEFTSFCVFVYFGVKKQALEKLPVHQCLCTQANYSIFSNESGVFSNDYVLFFWLGFRLSPFAFFNAFCFSFNDNVCSFAVFRVVGEFVPNI